MDSSVSRVNEIPAVLVVVQKRQTHFLSQDLEDFITTNVALHFLQTKNLWFEFTLATTIRIKKTED